MRNPPLFALVLVLSLLFAWAQPTAASATDALAPRQTDHQDDAPAVHAPQRSTAIAPGRQRSVVDAEGQGEPAIAVDATDRVGISYYGPASEEGSGVRLARDAGNGWAIDAVPYPAEVFDGVMGARTALAFDAQGRSHIAYVLYTILTQRTYYAAKDDEDVWYVSAVFDPPLISASSIAIAAGADGYTRITYCTQSEPNLALQLWYVEMASSGNIWIKMPLGKEGCWESTAVAVDDAGIPHIAYAGRAKGESETTLKYAKWVDGTWSFEVIDASNHEVLPLSLAVTPDGIPHIAYLSSPSDEVGALREVRYATWDGATWQIQTIAAMQDDSQFPGGVSLALDAAGQPHVAYVDTPTQTLQYVRLQGDAWQKTPVTEVSGRLGPRGLALDSMGLPHLAYTEAEEGLIYLRLLPRTPEHQLFLPLMQ